MQKLGYGPREYAWPIVRQLFSNNFETLDWLRLMDHLLMRQRTADFLNYILIAFIICNKHSLMQVGCFEDLSSFQMTVSNAQLARVLKTATKLYDKHSSSCFMGCFAENIPIRAHQDCYEQFLRYPDHFVRF
jgi:hypothetical protein